MPETPTSEYLQRMVAIMGLANGLTFMVTSVTDVNNFESTMLQAYFEQMHLGDGVFATGGWRVRCEWDAGAAAAAPQGEARLINGSDVSAGQITHTAFSATLVVGDFVTLIPPEQYESMLIRGGANSLQDVRDAQDQILDVARNGVATVTMDGTELTLYEETDGHVFVFEGAWIDFTGLNAGAGEDTTIKVYVKEDGTNYRKVWEATYLAAAVPDPPMVWIPNSNDGTDVGSKVFNNGGGVKVTAEQAAVGGGWNDIPIYPYDSKRGG